MIALVMPKLVLIVFVSVRRSAGSIRNGEEPVLLRGLLGWRRQKPKVRVVLGQIEQ